MLTTTNDFSVAFYIGHFAIHWYSIFVFIAFLVSYVTILISAKLQNIPLKHLENFIFILFPIAIIFARIWYILGDIDQFMNWPFWYIFDLSKGGIAIEGGIIGGVISGYFWFNHASKITNISIWKYADLIMPNVLLGQAIGRWGNFFNQEILGDIVTSGFPHILPAFIKDHLHLPNETNDIVRQPLFLYESFFNFIGWLLLAVGAPIANKYYKKMKNDHTLYPNGILFFSYLIYYGIVRTCIEPFRYGDFIMKWGPIPVSILLSVIFILVGIVGVFILFNQRYQKYKDKILFEKGNKLE